MEEGKVPVGVLKSTLTKSFRDLKESRINTMNEQTEIKYRRQIEDIMSSIRQCDIDSEDAILDILPMNAGQGINPSAFDPDKLMAKRINIALSRRELSIKLGIYVKEYEKLFGPYADFEKVKDYLI